MKSWVDQPEYSHLALGDENEKTWTLNPLLDESVELMDKIYGSLLPHFRSAASLGLGLCWKAGIAAEVIGLPAGTVGEALYNAKVYYETADLFAWTVVIVAMSVVVEKLFLRLVDAAAERAGA